MARKQMSTRRKEQKAPKNTSCPRAARPFLSRAGVDESDPESSAEEAVGDVTPCGEL